MPGIDNELSNACYDFEDAREELQKKTKQLKDEKDALAVANIRVAELMVKRGMTTCRRGRLIFTVKQQEEVKPKVVAKEII